MATILVGKHPSVSGSTDGGDVTFVSPFYPADGTGLITLIHIWVPSTMTNAKIGIFGIVTPPNTMFCRSVATVGEVLSGGERNFVVSLSVVAGDYIGVYTGGAGQVYRYVGTAGYWRPLGDKTDGATYNFGAKTSSTRDIGLYGEGETVSVGQPYILRVQGIPGMRSFSQMGHGGL